MTSAELFRLGKQVNFALPAATLKPSDAEMKIAAQKLGIKQTQAWRAWTRYTWEEV